MKKPAHKVAPKLKAKLEKVLSEQFPNLDYSLQVKDNRVEIVINLKKKGQ